MPVTGGVSNIFFGPSRPGRSPKTGSLHEEVQHRMLAVGLPGLRNHCSRFIVRQMGLIICKLLARKWARTSGPNLALSFEPEIQSRPSAAWTGHPPGANSPDRFISPMLLCGCCGPNPTSLPSPRYGRIRERIAADRTWPSPCAVRLSTFPRRKREHAHG